MELGALRLSFTLAALTTSALLVVGLPLAWWLASSRWRFKAMVEAVVSLPLVLPPTVLGFYLLVTLGPHGALGRAWIAAFGRPLAFSFTGLLVASILCGLPFAVQPFAAGIAAVDRRLIEASYGLGASRARTFRRVTSR
jgi:molybdate transport system permease protein